MEPSSLISLAHGMQYLTEAKAKILLSRYGVPVVEESIATNENDAIKRSEVIGFPVVLKGLGTNLTHKTERGLVKVDLRSQEEVRQAFRYIKEAAGTDWEGCLIQPMIQGKREFVAGLYRDAQFGPVVMFGLGGVYTEAIGDVVFRIAPLSRLDALGMMEDLSSRKLLSDFRGELAANREQLTQTLMGLSQLGIEHPEVMEVDINPLIIERDGGVVAVDALVVINKDESVANNTLPNKREAMERIIAINAALDVMTHPKSIAVIGAKRSPSTSHRNILDCLRDFGFPGKLYPINPNVEKLYGYKSYPDLFSLPEPVDLVIVSLPAKLVPKIMMDCVATGNKNVHIFSAGFKETGEEEGIRLQAEIEEIARKGGLHVIGPNCMGLYVPESRITMWPKNSSQSGPLAFISQSGGHAQDLTRYAHRYFGINASKVFSFGNALTLDSTDFLEYLAQDDETRIIGMYLEGVKDGRRLLELVKKVNRTKPVIILKAGLTNFGARAVSSHTGVLAGGKKIWNAFFRQSGAVQVDSLEEMSEVSMAFLQFDECRGRRVAVIGYGGGVSVAAADECSKVGLDIPALSPDAMKKLREFIPPAGNIIRNPIDAHQLFFEPDLLGQTLELLSQESYLDMFVIFLHLDWLYQNSGQNREHIEKIATYIATEARSRTKGRPLIVVWRQYQDIPEINELPTVIGQILLKGGVPFYNGLTRGVNTLSKLVKYHEFQNNQLVNINQ